MQTLQKKNSQIQNKFETAVQHLQKYHQGNYSGSVVKTKI